MGVPNTETGSLKQQVNNASPDGAILGKSATDQIAFYGTVPLPQRTPIAAVVAGFTTTAFTTTANTSATGTAIATNLATAVLGNWTTLASQSVGTSTYSVTVNGWTNTGTALTASNASFNSVQANVLDEVCRTLIGLGIWKAV